jgi:hypothetical protein
MNRDDLRTRSSLRATARTIRVLAEGRVKLERTSSQESALDARLVRGDLTPILLQDALGRREEEVAILP